MSGHDPFEGIKLGFRLVKAKKMSWTFGLLPQKTVLVKELFVGV
jgi:hypothetical protein